MFLRSNPFAVVQGVGEWVVELELARKTRYWNVPHELDARRVTFLLSWEQFTVDRELVECTC